MQKFTRIQELRSVQEISISYMTVSSMPVSLVEFKQLQ